MSEEPAATRIPAEPADPDSRLRWWVTGGAMEYARLPGHLADRLGQLTADRDGEATGGVVVTLASEVIRREELPPWADTETFYLVFDDVPAPALMRLPTLLRIHKPDRRVHVTGDPLALRRLVVARSRRRPEEGIVDAYVVADDLVLVQGDLTVRSFPRDQLPVAGELPSDAFAAFELDDDGSALHWSGLDVDLGVASILQAVDPSYRADVEVERLAREDTGDALRAMREEQGVRQRDIPGLSERHVRRLEKSTSRLTAETARCFARAFDLSLEELLERLGERLRERLRGRNPE